MPDQLADQTLITYPVDKQRLDVFTAFLDPADVEPAAIRKAELTPIIAQLVASNRGVAALPNWALTEYMNQGWLRQCRLGPQGYGARSTPRCAARTRTPRTSMNS